MIETQHLTKRYGAATALDDVSFTVPKGQVLGLLGLNGAGKSTTMNLIAGCLAPTAGRVLVGGVDMAEQPARAKGQIGYLPEIPPLYVDMEVGEFLAFVCGLKKLKDKKGTVAAAAERAGVSHVLGRLIRNLSKGYRQRVGLAAAMLGDPQVLILDEPTVGLDPTQIIEIRTLISQLGRERTVILSSHILPEIQAVCERVIVLDRGRVVADGAPGRLEEAMHRRGSLTLLVEGPPEAVLEAVGGIPGLASVECLGRREEGVWAYEAAGRDGADIRRDLFFALSGAGLPLLGSRGTAATLEDVFLRLVSHGGEGENL